MHSNKVGRNIDRKFQRALLAAFTLFCGLAASGCHRKPSANGLVEFRIGGVAVVNPDQPTASEPEPSGALGYAIHTGGFQRELRKAGFAYEGLVGYPRTAASLLGLGSGQVQVASTGDSPAVLSRARGDKQRAIWIGLPTGDIWVVGRKDGPQSIRELSGRKVGVLFGSTAHYIMRRAAEVEGVPGISYAQLEPAVALHALKRGDIDAYAASQAVTAETWRARFGLPIIAKIGTEHPELQGVSVMTARSDFLTAHPTFAGAFWRGLKTGIDAIRKDPDAYYRWVSDKTGVPIATVRATAAERYADTPFPKEGVDALQRLLAFQIRTGLANSSFSVADWATGPTLSAGADNVRK
ncbi:ABC transporter substrate-binding protein [Sphingomonas crusticola]|uniref:ABC transporter substrate-binding protein n=1 Tax=Sphingomonas crusticola TaxID=1697973 RepID=UPI0013C34EEA|nr:ABC transporter substrate-binding protein [Sphingomonas crusticola]